MRKIEFSYLTTQYDFNLDGSDMALNFQYQEEETIRMKSKSPKAQIHKMSHPLLREIFEKENLHTIRCAYAPFATSSGSLGGTAGHPYPLCEGKGVLVIHKKDGKITAVGHGDVQVVRKTVIARIPKFLGSEKVLEIEQSFTIYDLQEDEMPCSAMYELITRNRGGV